MKNIIKKLKNKILWSELFIIASIFLFIFTTFLLNFWIGMYLLSIFLGVLGYLIFKIY
ncbi:hypothetical protein [Clostridium perfringens str. 13]|uniref:Uncharacterized protein n=1 Tax=Clostridium perfringens (strain 13 / Type A) TaxID=195102 RepID=Q8XLC3_CLOPE|nr:hypothetical protein [Clostridium perfringens str. 13]